MRIMGIDFGDARTGLAVSDEMNILVGDVWTLNQRKPELVAEEIAAEAAKRGVQRLVLGLPKNMDGTIGFRGEKTIKFAEELKSIYDGKIDF